MKKFFLNHLILLQNFTLLFLLISFACCSQIPNKDCVCSKNEYVTKKIPDTIFTFSNHKSIYVCGFREIQNKKLVYSEFVIGTCGEDTILGFWGALKNCSIFRNQDTVMVGEFSRLPVGDKFSIKQTILIANRFYYSSNSLVRDTIINSNIRKYSTTEIQKVLMEYERFKIAKDKNGVSLLNKLFVATISGSGKAEKWFYEMGEINNNGELSELYDELNELLRVWKAYQQKNKIQ
jgi:hypothetical protein